MSEQSAIGNRQSAIPRGFTPLEVVVAMALMGAVLVVALELLAVGLRSAKGDVDHRDIEGFPALRESEAFPV